MSEEKKFLDGVGLKHYHDTQVKTHIDNKSNPHGVTASQVGAYTKEEVNSKLSGKANTSDLESLRQSFQDGCDTIVAGCTTYGETPASNSPSDIVGAIGTIYTERYNEGVTVTKKGTAVAADVLSGKTFTNASSVAIAGAMTNNGAISTALVNGSTYTIPAGYHNGSGKITVQSLANATSAADATATQILTGKTAWVNGSKITGTMPNNGNITWKPTSSTTASYGSGYYTGITLDSSKAYDAGVAAGKVGGDYLHILTLSSQANQFSGAQQYSTTYFTKNSNTKYTVAAACNALVVGTFYISQTTKPSVYLKINETKVMTLTASGTSGRIVRDLQIISLNVGDTVEISISSTGSDIYNSVSGIIFFRIN